MATKDNDMSFASPPLIDDATLDQLMAQIDAKGLHLLGPEGVLTELTSAIMNRAMQAELSNHMGYEPGDPAGWGSGNNRNGSSDVPHVFCPRSGIGASFKYAHESITIYSWQVRSMTARHEITRKFALAYAGASKVAQFECVTNGRICATRRA